jgi:hypothetical protein
VDCYDDSTTITDSDPNELILIHDQGVYFDSSAELLPDCDIDTTTDCCILHANLHHYIHNTVTDNDPHVPTWQEHYGAQQVKDDPRDYEALRPCFAWLNSDIIRKTFEVTTLFAWLPLNTVLRKHFKALNPAMNVPPHDEPMATDTIQLDTPAINGGEKYAQFFVRVIIRCTWDEITRLFSRCTYRSDY